ncbi:MAG: branched-chain amino acid ABC transporter substrate-binding protein [Chloroflexi bacterium]|nr:branched-chain amino acid ABC transporter substrate-binding protein [Chloroflexota bacterium]
MDISLIVGKGMRRIVVWLLLLGWLVTGCSSAPKGEVTVYVAAPLSGFQANGGQTVVGGVRLAAEEINRSGGLLGYQIRVVALDDESDSDVAVQVAEQIRQAVQSGERVLGVVGHYNSGQTLAAMEIYKDLPIVVITPTASELSLTQRGYRNFFRVNANDAVQARVDAAFLVEKLNARRVAVIHNDTEYGIGLRDLITQELKRLGADVVLTLQVAEGQSQYAKEVARVQEAAPDAIFYAGYEIEAPYLRSALVRAGISVPMLASDGAFLSATIDESDGTAEGMYVSAFAPSPALAVDEDWIKAYQAVEYRNPDTYSINGYVAMTVLAEGARKAGKVDGPQIAAALREARIDTLIGPIRYEENGDLQDPKVFIFQVREDAFVQIQ